MDKKESKNETPNNDDSSLLSESLNELSINNSTQSLDDGFDEIEDRDPEIEDYCLNFRKIYQNQFVAHLKSLTKNDVISVTSLPTKKYCKETFDQDLMDSTTLNFNFEEIECDENGNINRVIATSFDRVSKYDFCPFLCNDYGPYFKTNLLACCYNVGRKNSKEEMFFIDLPLNLYILLESE
jgi:hypothetical protein